MGFARYILEHPNEVELIALAEPNRERRKSVAKEHGIPKKMQFSDWKELASKKKLAHAVIIATLDSLHTEPTIAFAEKGYAILLEKPMAQTEEECRKIVSVIQEHKVLFAVCHVMRYTHYTQTIKTLIDAGTIGEVINIQHLEPVGYWHQAHSFVRGNWATEKDSGPMLLTKSCHDMDWIRYIMGRRCISVSSFGGLNHFRAENKPSNAGDNCLQCTYEPQCPYSAVKIYLGRFAKGVRGWPLDVLTLDVSEKSLTNAIKSGNYGKCVYQCENDVVDHQVVNMLFEGNATATHTMMAFTEATGRRTRIFGTRGEMTGDGSRIRTFNFLKDHENTLDTRATAATISGGHGGGDDALMKSFIEAVSSKDQEKILSGITETLETHLMTFAAEKARKENRVVNL